MIGRLGSGDAAWQTQRAILCAVFLLLALPTALQAYRVLSSVDDPLSGTHAVFEPYAAGDVGYYGEPANPTAERVNEGSPFSPDTPRLFFHAPLQQTCPGMVGPVRDDEYYCHGREFGFCDRRSGLCVCNQGYTGLDCTSCQPGYFKQGGLCAPKKRCPNDCSRGGECDYATGICTCDVARRGADCSEKFCVFDKRCVSCTSTSCLQCVEGFYVDSSTQTCVSCKGYDPRCLSCDASGCLSCADPLLNSVRRSGARNIDAPLPADELTREFSRKFVYGSQDPRVFDEAEPFTLVPLSLSLEPLNKSSRACIQGTRNDALWTCNPISESHRVCGHRGVFSFASPLYAADETSASITVTVRRSGGGLGHAVLLYDLQHVTTSPGDVSPTAFYTSSQRLDFTPGIVELSFKLQIHDDHVFEGNETFRLVLRDPFEPDDGLAVPPASLGNQCRALVTIIDDDETRPVPSLSYVVEAETTLARGGVAGDELSFQIQSILGNGVPGVDADNEALFLMESYLDEFNLNENEGFEPRAFRDAQLGSISRNGGVDGSVITCTWKREHAGNYTVGVYLLYPGGLRGDYFGDAWLSEKSGAYEMSEAIVSRIDRHVNFTWGNGPAFPGAQSHLSARWTGWLKPLLSEETLIAVWAIGYARLWLDDTLIIDHWGAGGEENAALPFVAAAAAVQLDGSRLYKLALEYRSPRSGDAQIRLLWSGSSSSGTVEVIPAAHLFAASHIQGSPFTDVPVSPATSASGAFSTSTLRNSVSIPMYASSSALRGIAGEVFSFHVFPRDMYGNRRRSDDQHGTQRDDIAARLTLGVDRSLGGLGNMVEDALVEWDGQLEGFHMTARPRRSGDYAINIQVNDDTLAGSPFTVTVAPGELSASRCVFSGPGLLATRVAGESVTVELETRDLHANRIYSGGLNLITDDLKAHVSHTSTSLPTVETAQVTDHGDGTYTFTYTPHVAGSYLVAVTWRGVHLHNSPYAITVVPSEPVASTSSAIGAGRTEAQTNVQASIEVVTRDSSGNDVPQGGVAVNLEVVLEHPESGFVSGDACLDLLNGHYICTYTAQFVGPQTLLHVKLANSPIIGSPFVVNVTAGPALGSRCVGYGDALVAAVAGERTNFTIVIHDAFGNVKANAGDEDIRVTFTGSDPEIGETDAAVEVAYAGNGEFLVGYALQIKGTYSIYVEVDGVAIDSSPFTMYTYPALASPTTTSLDLISPVFPTSEVDPPLAFVAGELIVARLTTRDSLGNTLESGGHSLPLDDDTVVREFLAEPLVDEQNGSYLLTLRPERSTVFAFTPKLLVPGGVNGSYYAASEVPVGPATAASPPEHSLSASQRLDAAIDFDFGERPPRHTQPMDTFSVRWEGFVLPRFSEIYTFELDMLGTASLRVGNTSVVTRVGVTSASLKVTLVAQSFETLGLNFTKPPNVPSASVRLLWSSLSQPREVVPSSSLFTSWPIVNNVPLLDVKPSTAEPTAYTAEFSASASIVEMSMAVQAVVGESLAFRVVARDRFGNALRGEDECTIHVLLPQLPSGDVLPDLTIHDMRDGSYEVELVPHLSGDFSMIIAALPDAQKLHAPPGGDAFAVFLRAYNIQESPFTLRVSPGAPSATTSTFIGAGFSVTIAGKHTTFALELRDGAGNRLTATMVTSARPQIQIELRSVETDLVVATRVSSVSTTSIIQLGDDEEEDLTPQELRVEYTPSLAGAYSVHLSVDGGISFAEKNVKLLVLPNIASALTSTVSPSGENNADEHGAEGGLGPQILTNREYTFHVTIRDALGNMRYSGGDLLVVYVRGPEVLAGNVTDLGNGEYVVAYRVAQPGSYEIETLVAGPERGLVGYYFSDSQMRQQSTASSAVRTVDPMLNFDWRTNASMRGYPRVQWRGFLYPRYTETYTLTVNVEQDSGSAATVFVDGQTVIDGLHSDASEVGATSGLVSLVGGRLHALVVEYRSASRQHQPGFLQMSWESDRQALELVPKGALVAEVQELFPRTQLVAAN